MVGDARKEEARTSVLAYLYVRVPSFGNADIPQLRRGSFLQCLFALLFTLLMLTHDNSHSTLKNMET